MNAEILKRMKETAKVKIGNSGKVYFYDDGKFKTTKSTTAEYGALELKFGGNWEILNGINDRYDDPVKNVLKIQVNVSNVGDEVKYLNTWDVKFFGADGVEIEKYNGGDYLEDSKGFDLEPRLLPGASMKENIYIEYDKKSPMFVLAIDNNKFVTFFLNDGTDEINALMK